MAKFKKGNFLIYQPIDYLKGGNKPFKVVKVLELVGFYYKVAEYLLYRYKAKWRLKAADQKVYTEAANVVEATGIELTKENRNDIKVLYL